MWVCNLCRKQQEILTKCGAWFYGSGPGQVRAVFEGGPQGKKAKLQDPSLYPYQGTSGDLTPASDRSRLHGGLLPRQASLDNGPGLRYPGPADVATDRLAGEKTHGFVFLVMHQSPTVKLLCTTMSTWGLHHPKTSRYVQYMQPERNQRHADMDATEVKFAFALSHSIGNKDQMHLNNKKKEFKWQRNPLTLFNHFFLHLNIPEVVGGKRL